jgi:hypothetical protein
MSNEDIQVEIRYSSYTPAQKKATQKYRQQNKEKVNEQRKKYYQTRKENDPNFLEYKRAKAREYYLKQKELRASKHHKEPEFNNEPLLPEPIIEPVSEPIIIPETDPVIIVTEPVIESVKVKKVRAKRTKKNIPTEEQKNTI